jgi:arabinogalactan oligomer/maltooligosaccharide transport system substrate-binding protein
LTAAQRVYRCLRVVAALAVVCCLQGAACQDDTRPRVRLGRVRFWHTFNSSETEALNAWLAGRHGFAAETRLLAANRGRAILHSVLADGRNCPDLIGIDSTWLPGLVTRELLTPVPHTVGVRDWLPETEEFVNYGGVRYALPQALEGLALVYHAPLLARADVQLPVATVDALVTAARRLTTDQVYGLGIRVDGYWFVPFLRAWGGDVLDPERGVLNIDSAVAATATERFAALFGRGGIAPPPGADGREVHDVVQGFQERRIAMILSGPWLGVALSSQRLRELTVAAFPPDAHGRGTAPRDGRILAVPRCASNPRDAWILASELTGPEVQADWGRRLGTVPTTYTALGDAGEYARQFYEALKSARPLPQHPITAELFEDLTPAVAAAVSGDASATEVLAGVARAWSRLLARHAPQACSVEAGEPPSALDKEGRR